MIMDTEARRTGDVFDVASYRALLRQYRLVQEHAQRWHILEAAHVVGQARLGPHWQTHVLMLCFAISQHDWREASGQLLRLALVPLGHLSGRLPPGNPGRATVSAFASMSLRPELAELILQARAESAR
ncbi:DUF3703 domain-containing protein [Paucibacter sp. PLA-PC-4]|uniref:DUF3703 domain-containing protein n=1 Tax=Paucibacter sp. PLA-PC-4 TaxID=2993655 RepID=UPI0022495D93|nr:DUF3703 domain-containing protein [Paucibacter sp. PLA-PC-4]MCX2861275.1 DUF3703 domain-containing protein [Paucibacter sp. PLA-PC-4]